MVMNTNFEASHYAVSSEPILLGFTAQGRVLSGIYPSFPMGTAKQLVVTVGVERY